MLLNAPIMEKSHAAEIQENLENKMKKVKSDLSIEYEKNRVLQENLKKTK